MKNHKALMQEIDADLAKLFQSVAGEEEECAETDEALMTPDYGPEDKYSSIAGAAVTHSSMFPTEEEEEYAPEEIGQGTDVFDTLVKPQNYLPARATNSQLSAHLTKMFEMDRARKQGR